MWLRALLFAEELGLVVCIHLELEILSVMVPMQSILITACGCWNHGGVDNGSSGLAHHKF
jgi:hypothetical protein